MKVALLTLVPAALGAAVISFSTDYTKDRALRAEAELTFSMETTNSEMTRDGEPVEGRGGGDMSNEDTRRIVQIDRVVEHKDGRPTKVRRTFETLEGLSSMTFGDNSRENEHECPLSGVTLELTATDDGVDVDVVEGDSPADDALLEGHQLTLAFDELLPSGDVSVGDSWELDSDAIKHALGLDLSRKLFPPPSRDGGEGGGRGQGRGGRGRGGFGRGGGGLGLLDQADWEGEATFAEESDYEGTPVAVIKLEMSASGEIEMPEFGRGRRGRDQALGLATEPVRENSYDIDLEGRLLFSVKEGRPVLFEIEGTVSTHMYIERDSERGSFTMSNDREGNYEYRVAFTEVKVE